MTTGYVRCDRNQQLQYGTKRSLTSCPEKCNRFSRINATIHIFAIFDAYASTYCDLDPWLFDLIRMSQPRYIHDPISVILAQIIMKLLYSPGFSGHCPLWPWRLTFDFLIPKANQYIYETKYICDQNWVKFPSLAFEILCSQGHCLLWPWPVTFSTQKLISRSMNPNTSVTKIEWNSLHWFSWHGVHKVFGTHRLTHSFIHSHTHRWTNTNTECLRHHFSTALDA